jgi:hypothetical protein
MTTVRGENGSRNAWGSTVAQLRDDIDHGRTGDKVDWPDPAAAPLGTDEEAAGTPVSPAVVASTRIRELAGTARSTNNFGLSHACWVQVAIVVVLIAAVIGWIVSQIV